MRDAFNAIRGTIGDFPALHAFRDAISTITGAFGDPLPWLDDFVNAIEKLTTFGGISVGGGGGGGALGTTIEEGKKVLGIGHTGGFAEALKSQTAVVQRFAKGGTVDTVPALLQPGEFVVRRDAVNALGTQFMQQVNKGKVPSGGNSFNFDMRIDIKTEDKLDENFVRGRLMKSIKEELKKASLQGEFLISQRGIRST